MSTTSTLTAPPAPFLLHQGRRPLLISIPHMGQYVPPTIAARLTPQGRELHDTDWHLDRLYDFAEALGASILQATHSRYVIDLNRPPDGASLYPGQNVTTLCPLDSFDNQALYLAGAAPDDSEIAARRLMFWQPYHEALASELARIKSTHGRAMLWDAHSIRSVVPRFFAGQLPDLNVGTADGASCAPELAQQLLRLAKSSPYTAVLNGRFKGGYITRHYGQPEQQVHAVQLELAQCTYMQESMPFAYHLGAAQALQPTLRALLETMLAYAQS